MGKGDVGIVYDPGVECVSRLVLLFECWIDFSVFLSVAQVSLKSFSSSVF